MYKSLMLFLRRFAGARFALLGGFALSGVAACVLPVSSVGPLPLGEVPSLRPALNQNSSITLLEQPATELEVTTPAGRELTLVASTAQGGAPALRFSVVPLETAYRLADGANSRTFGAAEREFGLPYRSCFQTHRQLPADPLPPARQLLQAPLPRELNSTDTFWINTGDSRGNSDRQQTCVLKRISDHGYFYIDQEAKAIPDANLDKLVTEWEERIYPRLTAVFGAEPRPGVDGETRIFIVLSPAVDNWGKEKGLMGYFWSRDAIPGRLPRSNQKEVLFMTDQLFDRPALTSFGTLAHEFQHLLNFSRKSARLGYRLTEETWLDEGLSMYAMEVAGYGLPAGDYHIAKDLRVFQEEPAAFSLTSWSENPNGFAYGQSYLFVRYLVDRFGSGVISEILNDNRAGVACVSAVLEKRGTTFAEHFRAWAIANYISDTPLAKNTPYSYRDLSLTGVYKSETGAEDIVLRGFQTRLSREQDINLTLKPWGTAYLTFGVDRPLPWRVKVKQESSARLLGATIVP